MKATSNYTILILIHQIVVYASCSLRHTRYQRACRWSSPASLQVIKVVIFGVQGVYLSVPTCSWKMNNKKKNLHDQFWVDEVNVSNQKLPGKFLEFTYVLYYLRLGQLPFILFLPGFSRSKGRQYRNKSLPQKKFWKYPNPYSFWINLI